MATIKQVLSSANLNTLSDILRRLDIGAILRAQPVQLFRVAASLPAPLDMIAAVHTVKLPSDAKCGKLLRAVAVAGTGTKGELIVDVVPMTAATAAGHAGFSQSGDLTFAAADAWTKLDLLYQPAKYDLLTVTLPVVAATGVCVVPAGLIPAGQVIVTILSAVATGGVSGQCPVVAPGAVPATSTNCNLDAAKTQAQFVIADAVVSAVITFALSPAVDVNALLQADSGGLL